jgi:hypothetical protein
MDPAAAARRLITWRRAADCTGRPAGGPEGCFGRAPSGTIRHSRRGSGSWDEMPGHGHAVYVALAGEPPDRSGKWIMVAPGNSAGAGVYNTCDDYPGEPCDRVRTWLSPAAAGHR